MTEAGIGFLSCRGSISQREKGFMVLRAKVGVVRHVNCSKDRSGQPVRNSLSVDKKLNKKAGKKEHHLWMKRDSAGSGQKALNLVRIVSELPNEKDAVYGALDKWMAWEAEFPLIAAAKALGILRKRNQWLRIIQVFADMEEVGVKPDQDTVKRVARAFQKMDQEDKMKLVLKKYQLKWKYLHFNGERVRVRTDAWNG